MTRIILCSLLFGTLSIHSFATVQKPNIILILADDLGYGELGCYGQEKIKTPCLDQMAKEGIRFTDFHSGAAICAPSRFTLITGQHIGHARSYGQGQHLKADEVTLHTLCKQAGYATAAIGKWGLGKDPNNHGIDFWYGFINQGYAHFYYPEYIWKNKERIKIPQNDRKYEFRVDGWYTGKQKNGGVYIHDEFTKEALQFIERNKSKPFFLYLPYTVPHLELVVPDDSVAPYKNKFPPRIFDAKKESPEARKNRPVGGTKFYDGYGYCSSKNPRELYAGMISRMDRDVGRIINKLKELGIDENTLIIFSSDNGPSWWSTGGCDRDFFKSAGPLSEGKRSFYEGGIRVPFIARWPHKIKPGITSDFPSYHPDVMPTIAELINATPSRPSDGVSLLPTLLQKGTQKKHAFMFWQHAVRIGKWKYITGGTGFHRKKGNGGKLYDMENDIAEKHDVSDQHPEIVERMKKIKAENKLNPHKKKKH